MRILFTIFTLAFVIGCKSDDPTPISEPYDFNYPVYYGNDINEPSDNPTTVDGVILGRKLFYEKMLSADSTVSCASCHQQQYAFTDGLAFSEGINGLTNRGSMSICNLMWQDEMFWDGRAATLEGQALAPIQDPVEMNLNLTDAIARIQGSLEYLELFNNAFGSKTVTADRIAKAIAQFERTLISNNSRYDQYLNGEYTATADEIEGINLFFTHPEPTINLRGGNCGDCHGGALTFQGGFRNNGMDSTFADLGRENVTGLSSDRGKFKVPALRNIALTAPYMHDGRFATLEEVLDHYNEHIVPSATLDPLIQNASNEVGADSLALTEDEKEKIILFLHMLTDSTFITNPEFSDPND